MAAPAPGGAAAANAPIQVAAFFAPAPTSVKLCESVDVFAGSANVKPGGTANFAIWLSSSGADSTNVTVALTTNPTAAAPHFAVCPSGRSTTCKLPTLTNGQVFELQAAVVVPKSSTNGQHVALTATLTATKPKATVKATATVTASVTASPTPTPSQSSSFPVTTTTGGLPSTTLPLVPGGVSSVSGGNVGGLLPSIPAVTPSPSALPAAGLGAPAPVANVGPLDRRLMGTQLIALAALCAAIGIVIAKFTLRTPRPAIAAIKPTGGGGAAGPAAAGAGAGTATAGASPAAAGSAGVATEGAVGPAGGSGDGGQPLSGASGDVKSEEGPAAKDSPLGKDDSSGKDDPSGKDGAAADGAADPADGGAFAGAAGAERRTANGWPADSALKPDALRPDAPEPTVPSDSADS
jgi:hypothetical protein